ncbi:putative AbiEii toxin of type IV toxin-antitoxin system [Tenacibaculum skagerrakense]|uniref:Putative AbiEii toxin of type IV toxin-antitoxin system n=1 Tax=Tenacibaculum skagerrakense TaxID=186571 RepID=A0A4R2NQY1_9FLAO|nr:AAA family ATPase [Tenacibaculum skagerrakense]TCP23871.1 putative AbiEii toxin of type IV toxin-antitoxin system [Tenacibaculum skagerrakense]
MILMFQEKDSISFPSELQNPTFYINEENEEFLKKELTTEGEKISCQLEIGQVNFFIGANNSGKSRFMRGLLKSHHTFLSNEFSYLELSKEIKNKQTNALSQDNKNILFGFFKYLQENDSLISTDFISNRSFSETEKKEFAKKMKFLKESLSKTRNIDLEFLVKDYIERVELYYRELVFSEQNKIYKKNYTPIIRSLLNDIGLSDYVFSEVVEKRYFGAVGNFTEKNDIHTGLELWTKIDAVIGSEKTKDIRDFEEFLSVNFFEGEKIILSPHKKERIIHINFEKQGYKGIHEIGDGIQTLILLLFPIFTAKRNEIFFIEEPEINLHPGFQRIFIETLLNNEFLQAKNLKYFFTTHSNHFLDLTLKNDKVSFFQFQKLEEGKHLIKTNIKPSKETLDELGVNTSSVLLANCSIWVEGPTDRKYLSKFLKLYCEYNKKQFLKEDIDYAFFEYGGNLIEHYLFNENEEFNDDEIREKINSFALSNKIFLLADNDNALEGSKKDLRRRNFESLSKDNNNFHYENTKVVEIENLLPKSIIQGFMSQLLLSEKYQEKSKSFRFNEKDYCIKNLGEFYEQVFSANKVPKKEIKKIKSSSGTLNNIYKIKLANYLMEGDFTYKDLIEENTILDELVSKLYNFIV